MFKKCVGARCLIVVFKVFGSMNCVEVLVAFLDDQ